MADMGNRKPTGRRQSIRLQRRAPASIQVNPAMEWNVAIPLLSPLVPSPRESKPMADSKSYSGNTNKESAAAAAVEKPVMWQHPAAPFFYEPAPFRPFVSTGSFDR